MADLRGPLSALCIKHFPEVTVAADKYKTAKPDGESRKLARRIVNEAVLFKRSVHLLLRLSQTGSIHSDDLHERVKSRLGDERASLLLSKLVAMEKHLSTLKGELANSSKGSEVLDKLMSKATVVRTNAPKASLHRRLDDLSKMNDSLASSLVDTRLTPLSMFDESRNIPVCFQSPPIQDQTKLGDFIRALSLAHSACEGPHALSMFFRCRDPSVSPPRKSESSRGDCEFEIILLPDASTSSSDSATPIQRAVLINTASVRNRHVSVPPSSVESLVSPSLPDTLRTPDGTVDPNADSSLLISQTIGDFDNRFHCAVSLGKVRKPFAISYTSPPSMETVLSLSDVICRRTLVLDQRARMDLALHLSITVLGLASSPWLDDSVSPKDWLVSIDLEHQNAVRGVFMRAPFHKQSSSTMNSSREPTLTKLGICLIELAFGRTLAEIRRDEPELLQSGTALEGDPELLDLFTAKNILTQRLLSRKFGQDCEDAVISCINQQYRERKTGTAQNLSLLSPSQEPALLPQEPALLSIVLPLFFEVRKRFDRDSIAYLGYEPATENNNEAAALGAARLLAAYGLAFPSQVVGVKRTFGAASLKAEGASKRPKSPVQGGLQPYPTRSGTDEAETTNSLPPWSSQGQGQNKSVHWATDPSEDVLKILNSEPEETHTETSDNTQPIRERSNPDFPVDVERAGQTEAIITSEEAADEIGDQAKPTTSPEEAGSPDEEPSSMDPSSSHDQQSNMSDWEEFSNYTDSGFEFLSGSYAEPTKLPADHELLKTTDKTLRVVLRCFAAYRSRGEAGRANSSSNGAEQAGSSKGQGSKKRDRGSSGKGKEPMGSDDEESNAADVGSSAKKQRTGEKGPKFACPFFKKDPVQHRDCSRRVLHRIRDVKQHIDRKHQRPHYCSFCLAVFRTETERDEHSNERICARKYGPKPDGITLEQKEFLRRRSDYKQTPEQQWFVIFDYLFPEHDPRPQSPWIDQELLDGILSYHDFLVQYGPPIMQRVQLQLRLEPPSAQDSEAYQQHLYEEGFKELFKSYIARVSDPSSGSQGGSGSVSEIVQRTPAETETEIGSELNQQADGSSSISFTAPFSRQIPYNAPGGHNINLDNFGLESIVVDELGPVHPGHDHAHLDLAGEYQPIHHLVFPYR